MTKLLLLALFDSCVMRVPYGGVVGHQITCSGFETLPWTAANKSTRKLTMLTDIKPGRLRYIPLTHDLDTKNVKWVTKKTKPKAIQWFKRSERRSSVNPPFIQLRKCEKNDHQTTLGTQSTKFRSEELASNSRSHGEGTLQGLIRIMLLNIYPKLSIPWDAFLHLLHYTLQAIPSCIPTR